MKELYCDHSSNFQELLQRDNSVTIHRKNIQALAIMMYKVVNNIAPTIVSYGARGNETKISLFAFKREIKQ